jgi:hypothetical protein
MSNLHNERYDEIKSLLKKSRMLLEQDNGETASQINIAQDIENNIQNDAEDDEDEYETADSSDDNEEETSKRDKVQKYRVSGGILALHGKNKTDLDITTDDKIAFQETMDEFVSDVSDLSDFGVLKVYHNEVQWSGKVIDFDLEFFFSIGENNGVYVNGDMIKLDDKLTELITKLTSFYEKFKTKWAKVISLRRKSITTEN